MRKIKNKTTKQYYILIDESGTLPDSKDKFIVICGVGIKKIKEAENIISRTLAFLWRKKTKAQEIKFYSAGQKTKRQFVSGIVSANFEIFALVVDKRNRKIADTPENFALLIAELISEINLWYKVEKLNIIIDRHFHRKIDQDRFDQFFRTNIDKNLKYQMKHVDSQQNPLVNIADMSAGAILWKYSGKDLQFYDLIKSNIVIEKIVNWPEIKRRSIVQN